MFHRSMLSLVFALLLSAALSVSPGTARAQDEPVKDLHAGHYIGSVFLSLFYVPYKLTTCVGGQVLGGATYAMTAGVPGNYDGGTHGAEIGTMATALCTGAWVITPEQLGRDYQRDPEPMGASE